MIITKEEARCRILKQINLYVESIEDKGYSFPIPPIDFRLKGSVAGRGGANILKFNLDIASQNLEHFLVTTVPHEMAHVIQRRVYPRSKPHGAEWVHFCKVLTGKSLPRCHSYKVISTTRPTQKVSCSCREYQFTSIRLGRMKKGAQYRCRDCKTIIKLS